MKKFFETLHRFVPPYRWYLVAHVVSNLFAALLNLASFAVIIPILRVLFRIDSATYSYIPWSGISLSRSSIEAWGSTLTNNFNYLLQQLMVEYGSTTALMLLGVFLVVMTLLKVGVSYLSSYVMVPLRTGVVRDIRNSINSKILGLHIGFFSEERKGDIMSRISNDVFAVEESLMSSLDMLFKNPIMIIVFLTSMIIISPQLTLFVLLLMPVMGYLMGKVGKSLKRSSHEMQEQSGLLTSMTEETLGGLRVVKAFHAEEMMQRRYDGANNRFRTLSARVMQRYLLAHPMSEFLGTLTIAIVLWFGGTLILNDQSSIDASTFIYYLIIFYSIINPAKDLTKCVYSIQRGMASLERVDRILLAQNEIKDPEEPIETRFAEAIRFDDVSFRYQEQWVLRHIDLTIPKGQTVAIVGASGSGKSTLVDLIPRFYDVIEGAVRIDGTDVRQLRVSDLRSLMGNVNQEAILFNDTVRNNIAFGNEGATLDQIKEAARIANAAEFVDQLPEGYDTNIGDRGGKLSGGQRQRLSIARAVLKNPDILILDEATSALDTASERLVQDALDRLMQGRTTIVIAHRLSTIMGADMICVLHEGRIVEQGTHAALLAQNGHYARLVKMQEARDPHAATAL